MISAPIRRAYLQGLADELGGALEARFHPTRKWRFDLAVPRHLVALEVDGGLFLPGGGRHNRPRGYVNDMEKLNAAAVLGWRVIRCTWDQVLRGEAKRLLVQAIEGGMP